MSSPFTLFRRHQRILMVILTGLAMVSFVLLGAVSDPRNMPAGLVILALAAMVGGVGWVAGLASGKASEWGITGVLMGVVVGLAVNWYNREPNLILMEGGNLSRDEVAQIRREREMANFFVQRAFAGSGERSQFDYLLTLPQFLFGITTQNEASLRELALDAVLRREADRMGIVISDETVKEFISEVTGGKMTGDLFREIRNQLQVSEAQLFNALRNEIKAREAARVLYDPNFIPPETYWDFYKKLNVRQSGEVAAVPVAEFIDKQAKPTDSELQELFLKYRDEVPRLSPEGAPLPGFVQPPRVRLAYLEAVHDDVERTIGEISEADIRQRYEDVYLRSMPSPDQQPNGETTTDGPELPAPQGLAAPDAGTSGESSTNTPAPEKQDAPTDDGSQPRPQPESSSTETQDKQPDAGDVPAPKTEADSPEESGSETSAIPASGTVPVAFYQQQPKEAPPAESETESEPAAAAGTDAPAESRPSPPADTSESAAPELPAPEKATEETPAAEPAAPAQSGEQPASTSPAESPAPPTGPRPLDDELKRQLRNEILQERTRAEIDKRIQAANEFMHGLSYNMGLGEDEANYMTEAEVAAAMKEYAQDRGLVYVETELVSFDELLSSEDYAIGSAYSTVVSNASVPELVFSKTKDLYQPGKAALFNPENYSAFSYWKIEEREGGVPDSIDDPKVREQVVQAWRVQQAWPKAKARAEELVGVVSGTGKPMGEVLSDETVTGKEGGIFLAVQETGPFTWMTRPVVPPTGLEQRPQVTLSRVPGAPQAGGAFMETVFHDLEPGETGLAPGEDGTVLYVVRIEERHPSSEEEFARLRQEFIESGNMSAYSGLAQMTMQEYSVDWVDHMLEQYDVRILAEQP